MKEIKAVIKPTMLENVLVALKHIEGLPGVTISDVKGFGKTRRVSPKEKPLDEILEHDHRIKLELVVPDELVEIAIQAIENNARTGSKGDGKIFISEVLEVVKIRTGERGRSVI